jgi:hypothetical protein
MIVTPAGFLPDHHAADDDHAIAHVFSRDRLVLLTDSPACCRGPRMLKPGLVAARRHVIGRMKA